MDHFEQAEPTPRLPLPPPRSASRWGGCGLFMVGLAVCLLLVMAGAVVCVCGVAVAWPKLAEKGPRRLERVYSGNSFAPNKIALVEVRGIILSHGDAWSQVAAADAICEQLQQAAEDEAVKAIVLRIDSPGGEVTASDLIHHQVCQVRERYGKVVVAAMESVAASGGLYVAVAADRIVAHRMTTTGSIGVIAQTINYHQLLDKIGLQSETYKSGPMKDLLSGARPRTELEREFMNGHIQSIYNEFVKVVAAGRPNLSEEKIRGTELGDGRIFSGQEALTLGLVDELGFFDDALALAAELADIGENYQLVYYDEPFSWTSALTQLRARPLVQVELPGTSSWVKFVEPGKAYFLPAR